MQCEICGNFFASTGGDTYNGKFVCDNCQLIVKNIADELALGDLLTKTHTELTGVTSDQHHAEVHTTEHENGGAQEISVAGLSGELADEQDAGKIKGKTVDDAAIGNDKIMVYKTATTSLVYEAKPAGGGDMTKAVYDTDDDGVVDDSEKLEASTKAQVQDHTPKAHTLDSHSEKKLDTLDEKTPDAGVTVDGCLIKDNKVADSNLLEGSTKAQVQDHADGDAIHDNVAAEINAIAEKGIPIDADLLIIEDSAAANAKKKVQIGNLPAGGGGGATFTVSGAQAYSGNSPNSWTDLDLSSIVGSNSAMVILGIKCSSDINAVAVRKNGDTEEYYDASIEANAYGCALGHHDANAVLVLICVTDTAGVIEWKAEGILSNTTVHVIAYIK